MTQGKDNRTSPDSAFCCAPGARRRALPEESLLPEAGGISANAVAALKRGRRTRPRPDTVTLLADALSLEGFERAEFISASLSDDSVRALEGRAPALTLPAAGRPLFGRDVDVASVIALLKQHRRVTLTGPGGLARRGSPAHRCRDRQRRRP